MACSDDFTPSSCSCPSCEAYGINTGFGNFANVIIPENELEALQANLIRSHAAGVGMPLSPAKTRMLSAEEKERVGYAGNAWERSSLC